MLLNSSNLKHQQRIWCRDNRNSGKFGVLNSNSSVEVISCYFHLYVSCGFLWFPFAAAISHDTDLSRNPSFAHRHDGPRRGPGIRGPALTAPPSKISRICRARQRPGNHPSLAGRQRRRRKDVWMSLSASQRRRLVRLKSDR